MSNNTNFNQILPQTEKWLSKLSSPPSGQFIGAMDRLIRQMIIDGNWSLLDRMWVFATEQQAHARVDIKALTSLSEQQASGPLTWTIKQGYKSDGSTSYLDSNFISNSQGVNFQLNNNSMGTYLRTNSANPAAQQWDIGGVCCGQFYVTISAGGEDGGGGSGHANAWNGGNNVFATSTATSDTLGLFSGVRTNSTTQQIWKSGVNITSSGAITNTNTQLFTNSFYILCANINGTATIFSPRQSAMVFFGSGNIDQTKMYNAFQTFMTTLGTQV